MLIRTDKLTKTGARIYHNALTGKNGTIEQHVQQPSQRASTRDNGNRLNNNRAATPSRIKQVVGRTSFNQMTPAAHYRKALVVANMNGWEL